jgi:hypothetical protein
MLYARVIHRKTVGETWGILSLTFSLQLAVDDLSREVACWLAVVEPWGETKHQGDACHTAGGKRWKGTMQATLQCRTTLLRWKGLCCCLEAGRLHLCSAREARL